MSKSSRIKALSFILSGAALTGIASAPASAHPHVWVTVRDEIVFENGKMTGVEHHWTFDESYTQMAIEGLDTNNDQSYSREELKELAQTNIDGLKDFDFFTFATIGEKKVPFAPPRDYWLEHTNGLLTLHFFLPLAEPMRPGKTAMQIAVTDPSFFISFSFAKDNAVAAAKGAPANCKVALIEETQTADQQALASAMSTQMVQIGDGISGTISTSCTE